MRKLLRILGILSLLLVVAVVAGFVLLAVNGTKLDEQSLAYVDRVVPEILTSMQKEALLAHASAELVSAAPAEEFDKVFRMFSRLGAYRQYQEASGESRIMFSADEFSLTIMGDYVARVEFESGPATVDVGLVKRDGRWQIHRFEIHSPVFLQ